MIHVVMISVMYRYPYVLCLRQPTHYRGPFFPSLKVVAT